MGVFLIVCIHVCPLPPSSVFAWYGIPFGHGQCLLSTNIAFVSSRVADPGFFTRGAPTLRWGCRDTILSKFPNKLHQIEKNWLLGSAPWIRHWSRTCDWWPLFFIELRSCFETWRQCRIIPLWSLIRPQCDFTLLYPCDMGLFDVRARSHTRTFCILHALSTMQ